MIDPIYNCELISITDSGLECWMNVVDDFCVRTLIPIFDDQLNPGDKFIWNDDTKTVQKIETNKVPHEDIGKKLQELSDEYWDDCPDVIGGVHHPSNHLKKSKVKRNFKIKGIVNKCKYAQDLYTLLILHPWMTEKLGITWIDVSEVELNKELSKKAFELLEIKPLNFENKLGT